MHRLTMSACPLPPSPYRAFVKTKCFDDCLDWTAIGQQRNHQQHRLAFCPQPVEDRSFRHRESLFALLAYVPLILLAMYSNISFPSLSPCGTFDIRAKYVVGVHWLLSWF